MISILLRLKKRIKGLVSLFVTKDIDQLRLDGCKLVMTLLVKNEVDVVRDNIEFHLRNGVDFIIATDNLSDDGTLEILQEYEKKGVLYLIQETAQDHN